MLTLSTIAFVLVGGFLLIIAAALTDLETPWPLTFFLLAGLIGTGIAFGFATVFGVIWANIYWIIIGFPFYLIAGGLWSVFKWDRFVAERYVEYKKEYAGWEKAKDNLYAMKKELELQKTQTTDYHELVRINDKLSWVHGDIGSQAQQQPKVERFKPEWGSYFGKLSNWIIFWPLSIVDYVLGDLLKELVETIMNALGDWYQARTDKRFS